MISSANEYSKTCGQRPSKGEVTYDHYRQTCGLYQEGSVLFNQ